MPDLTITQDGAEHFPGVCDASQILDCLSIAPKNMPGVRLYGNKALAEVTGPEGVIGQYAARFLGASARPVRAVLFDKTPQTNWHLGWHQDRTIVVLERHEVPGFGPWTCKQGALHVEPPFEIIEKMVTLRVHLDPCGQDNAPLLIAPGSHRLGKIPADEAAETAKQLGPSSCLAEAGDIWAYATAILHASNRASDAGRRRVLQIDYAAEDLPPPLTWAGL